jgi:hypothetical protein
MNPDNNKIILNKIQVKIKNIIFTYIKIMPKVVLYVTDPKVYIKTVYKLVKTYFLYWQ